MKKCLRKPGPLGLLTSLDFTLQLSEEVNNFLAIINTCDVLAYSCDVLDRAIKYPQSSVCPSLSGLTVAYPRLATQKKVHETRTSYAPCLNNDLHVNRAHGSVVSKTSV